MTVTALEVEHEHVLALASLTEAQRKAISRLQQAKQRAHFNGRFPADNLQLIFAAEAEERTRQLAA
jgi:hypothetical protein